MTDGAVPVLSGEQVDSYNRYMLVSHLHAMRRALGMTDYEFASKIGWLHRPGWFRRATVWYWLPRLVKRREADLLEDGRLSTMQRYARVVGLDLRPSLVRLVDPRQLKGQRLQRKKIQNRRRARRVPITTE
ncbi:MAG TPA: hypothetical protein VM581_03500 [Magnetospirillaceae bacterium]|nr:hypothetical protein [Magnetospirillaceae bacterium]